MRIRLAGILVCLSLFATPVLAQSPQTAKQAKHQSGTIKMWIGVGLVVIVGSMAATSHQSASATSGGFTVEASATSTSQLVTGLAIAGTGGYLLWNGLSDRKEADAMPSTTWGVSVGKRNALFIRHTW